MTANELESVRLLGVYTGRSFLIWNLAGDRKAAVRAHVMTVLCGTLMPQKKSGVNALRDAFKKLSGISGHCTAEEDSNLCYWCKHIESEQGWDNDRNYGRKQDD